MTEAEIRKYDPEDIELKTLMGDKFRDKSQEARCEPENAEWRKVTEDATEAEYEAVMDDTEGKSYLLHSIKSCVSVLGFGCLTLLIFFWQDAGLMDISVAEPSMCVCSAMAGVCIGQLMRRWK